MAKLREITDKEDKYNELDKNVKVIIVGAGIGGLSTGIRLLKKGYEVSIYEKNSYPGGCIHYISSQDERFKIDESASLAINPLTYEEIFKAVGRNPSDYFTFISIDNYYKVFTYDNKEFSLNRNLVKTQENLKKIYDGDVEGYTKFICNTFYKYSKAKNQLLNKPYINKKEIYNLNTLKTLQEIHTISTASTYVKNYVKSEDLQQLILFQTFFMGISPYKIPNIYTSVAANTQVEGLIHIRGGLAAYILALEKLFLELGGKVKYNSKVEKVICNSNVAKGIVYEGKLVIGDKIVLNVDFVNGQRKLLKRNKIPKFTLSCSTFIIHLGLSKIYKSLEVHNLYLNKDFKKEIEKIFKGKLPVTPSLYIYYPSIKDNSFCENPSDSVMNIMVRVPNLQSLKISWNDRTKKKLYDICVKILTTLPQLEDIKEKIIYRSCTTPINFQYQYEYFKGSCFGIGHTYLQSLAFRPQIKDKEFSNIYYVGGSIHPGNGASIVMDCAKSVVDEIVKSRDGYK